MTDYKYIGKPIPRLESRDKVTGATVFGADLNLSKQLHAAVLRSPYPHANILSIDTSKARSLKGVKVVITGEDVKEHPGIGHYAFEMPILAHKRVLYEGDPVAAVAAEDLETACEALKLIKVEYEPLKPILTTEESMKGEIVLQDWDKEKRHPEMFYIQGTNVCHHHHLEGGDVEKGFAESDIIVEGVFETSGIQHVCLEGHVSIAKWDSAGLTIWGCMQSPFFVRGQLSKTFNLPYNKVRMIITPLGGGFGNKWELRSEPIAAALAMRSKGRPVKLVFTRKDEFYGAYVRGGQKIWIKSGVNKDGTLVARKVTVYADSGAYVTSAPRIAFLSSYAATGPYYIDNVLVDNYALLTNKQVTSAYRGFGVAEVSWANECHMDDIAKKIGMDPVKLRLQNVWQDGGTSPLGEKLISVGVKECIEEAARLIGWDEELERVTADGKLHGRGLACTCKVPGTPSGSSVMCKLNEDGTVTILKSGTDMGQGNDTITLQFFAEAFGISMDKVNVAQVDTLYTPYEKSATGSRLTFHMGRALIGAAHDMHQQLAELMSKKWECPVEHINIIDGVIYGHDKDGKEMTLAINDLGKSKVLNEQPPVIGRAAHSSAEIFVKPDKVTGQTTRVADQWFWCAHACQVAVDPKTGAIEIEKYAAAHDVGQVINKDTCTGQVEGGVAMGLGHALLEELMYDGQGKLLNGNMADFKVYTAKDTGYELKVSLVEHAHPEGPYGAKGIGEVPTTAVPPAVGNAIADATGIRMTSIPIKADSLYIAIKAAKSVER
ncbi:MAG: xanthine dehydrogenase family protein molybdopterin-binding subunit [Clostridia bacterium]